MEEQSNQTLQEQGARNKRKPYTDAEKAQIRMLLRTLGIILSLVVLAVLLAAIISNVLL